MSRTLRSYVYEPWYGCLSCDTHWKGTKTCWSCGRPGEKGLAPKILTGAMHS